MGGEQAQSVPAWLLTEAEILPAMLLAASAGAWDCRPLRGHHCKFPMPRSLAISEVVSWLAVRQSEMVSAERSTHLLAAGMWREGV